MTERRRLPDTRPSVTHRVVIESGQGPLTMFVIAGLYDDGRVGEVFVNVGKLGSTLQGVLNDFARAISFLLQYGVPVEEIADRFQGAAYPPAGRTSNAEIPEAKSLVDYVVRWLKIVAEVPGG